MDKNRFISFLHRYTESSAQEADEIILLKSQYPYSQLLHTLSARVAKDHALKDYEHILNEAAIHAGDRSVLKYIITADSIPSAVGEKLRPAETTAAISSRPIQSFDTPVDVADELMRDLEKLNALKSNFEMLFVEYSEVTPRPRQTPQSATESKQQEVATEKETDPHLQRKEKIKLKKQRIIELARLADGKIQDDNTVTGKYKAAETTAKENPGDALIEEIKVKKEIAPEGKRQKEQMEIIEQFIKSQPSISNAKERQTPPSGDLTTIKSGEFGDNIISETLVDILIKQGKKDRAIEVLKKLIWKYPQKKSYFASQIEDLKK